MMKASLPVKIGFILIVLLFFGRAVYPQSGSEPGVLRNPLNARGGADPWLTYYDGNYYLAATTWTSELTMRKAPTLAGLKTAEPVRIYHETDPSRCCNIWAPEFYLLDGPDGPRWYVYYTAGTDGTHNNQHTHVLESAGTDPLGPYTYKGRLYDPQYDTWAIDGSVMELNDTLYFLFSAWVGANQSLFIMPMHDPWTLEGTRVLISQPEYDWERVGLNVNEAPVALHHDEQTFIVYSASFCATPDYRLGMLTYTGGDPLRPEAWAKHPEPVFQRSDANGVFGPGHNGFFQSPDGTEHWIVYHANDSVNGGCDGRRTTRVQPFTWNDDGTPNFGVPVSTETDIAAPSGDTGIDPLPQLLPIVISRFRALHPLDAYMRHRNFQIRLDFNVNPLPDSQFIVVPGLADAAAVSIESVNFPGYFLRQRSNVIFLGPDDGSETYAGDATWWLRPGLADETGLSFESYIRPGDYIGQMMGVLALVTVTDATPNRAREQATFFEER